MRTHLLCRVHIAVMLTASPREKDSMCSKSKAQQGVVYRSAGAGFQTETLLDPEGGFVAHVPVGSTEDEERFILNEDGTFSQVRFDMNAGPGQCPWKIVRERVQPPHELEQVGMIRALAS
jgi:hypothetical protein